MSASPRKLLHCLGLCLLLAPAAQAAQAPPSPGLAHGGSADAGACRQREVAPANRPRVALVLGGGGARGIAHISVLRELERLHVPVDCVFGTSMGSLVGALYASGKSVDDIQNLVETIDWATLFNDKLRRPERSFRRKTDDVLVIAQPGVGIDGKGVKLTAGMLSGESILLEFERLVEPVATVEDFDQLPIPYRAVASDINDGSRVVIEGGDLALAMRASMSIPAAFSPVVIGDRVLVDGGIASNLPVEVARAEGADIIIAVDVGTPLSDITPGSSVLAITDQMTGLLTVGNTKRSIATLNPQDVLISPPLGKRVATADFSKVAEALAIGMEGVQPVLPRLQQLGISEADYAQNLAVRAGRTAPPPVIEFVRLDNKTRYGDRLVLAKIPVPLGQPLDSAELERKVHAFYGYNTLSLATYEVVEEDGKAGVVLHLREKNQGPNYLEAGLSLTSDFEGSVDFNLRVGMLRSPINDSGGELRAMLQLGDEPRLLGEYYQPFGDSGHYVFLVRGEYDDRKINEYNAAGDKTAEYSAARTGLVLTAGREFGNYGALMFGYERYTGRAEAIVGSPLQPDFDFETGDAYVDFTIDRVDSAYFPRDGYKVRNRYIVSRDSLGGDADFDQFEFDGLGARSFGAHSVQFGLRYHVTISGIAPVQSLYRLGGYSRLVGFSPNQLTGQDYGIVFGGYTYQLGQILGQKALLGGSLEYGNAWQQRGDMRFGDGILNGSVFIGADTWIGPLMLGLGAREGGERNVFLTVGEHF